MVFSFSNFWRWPAIEDVHCCAELISRYMLEDTYNIPVRLGSDLHLLRCVMSIMTKELTIEGLWEGYDTDSKMFNRSIKSLSEVAGQEYTLLYPIDGTDKNGRIQFEASAPMKCSDDNVPGAGYQAERPSGGNLLPGLLGGRLVYASYVCRPCRAELGRGKGISAAGRGMGRNHDTESAGGIN